MHMKSITCLLTMLLVSPFAIQADVLVQYNFGTSANDKTMSPSSVVANMTATPVSGNNLNSITYSDNGATNPTLAISPTLNVTHAALDIDATLADAAYCTFTITPEAGKSLSLTNITFQASVSGASSPRAFYLFSSVEGFTESKLLLGNSNDSANGGTLSTSYKNQSVTLSGTAYQNITSPVEFRFYIQVPGNYATLRFDNIAIEGSLASIPEPSNAAICLVLTALFAGVLKTHLKRISGRK